MCRSGLSCRLKDGCWWGQSANVIAAVICCVAMEAKQMLIRDAVRRQHTYVKCDCEEANRQKQAPSRDQALCEGEERSRELYTNAAVCIVRRMKSRSDDVSWERSCVQQVDCHYYDCSRRAPDVLNRATSE